MKPKIIKGVNATIELYHDYVIKKLKIKAGKERLERFRQECKILQCIPSNRVLNVVRAKEVKLDDNPPCYKMERFNGNSNALLDLTRANVRLVVNLMIPIVNTLKILFENDPSIIHRDIKPENLLYRKGPESVDLFLSDFGCAFLQEDDAGRITNAFRSVGAVAFRAPEYQHGRVEQVTEKGDIFSVGKLLWYYVNGIKKEVFPYTLWYQSEYNLENRYPGAEGIAKLNSIVASCCHGDPSQRTNYINLLDTLTSILEEPIISQDEDMKLKARTYDDKMSIQSQEMIAKARMILSVFLEDTQRAINVLPVRYGISTVVKRIQNGYRLIGAEQETLRGVVERESDYPLWNYNMQNFSINSRFYPAKNATGQPIPVTQYPFISISIQTTSSTGSVKTERLTWFFDSDNTLKQVHDAGISPHNANSFVAILESSLDHCFS